MASSMALAVLGVRVHGDSVTDVDVHLDDSFKGVPVPNKIGIPLAYKLMSGTGGDDSHIKSNAIVRFMADPDDGWAPDTWQYGGRKGPAPPVVLARKDKLPFSVQDWLSLDKYMSDWREELFEPKDDRGDVGLMWLTIDAYKTYVRDHKDEAQSAMLSLQFPIGSTVVPSGLSLDKLNGRKGKVKRYSRDRVGVQFPDGPITALKPERLTLIYEAALPDPTAKQQDTGYDKEAKAQRQEQMAKQDCQLIAERFLECLNEDTFPYDNDELHLFGLGCEYPSRAQEAFAVWQAAAKNGDLTAVQLKEALNKNDVLRLFKEITHRVAYSRLPNSPYAKSLVDANFAALEFDTL